MRRLVLFAVPILLAIGVLAGPAVADSAAIASVIGTRVIVSAAVPALVPTVATAFSTVVTETLAPGNNSWTVTIEACGPNNYTTPTAADCATEGLTNAAVTPDVLPESALSVSARAVTPVGAGAGVTAASPSGSAALSTTPTLFTSSGQVADGSTTYDGVYTATANITLSPPGGTAAGVYKGYLVVTLVE